jgi:hypothetical protein
VIAFQIFMFTLLLVSSVLLFVSITRGWVNVGFASIIILVISVVVSFVVALPAERTLVTPKILVGDRAIYVEAFNHDFMLRKVSEQSILKADKIYIQANRNCWGIEMQQVELVWGE